MVKEVTNALWKAIKLRRITQEDAKEALKIQTTCKLIFMKSTGQRLLMNYQ